MTPRTETLAAATAAVNALARVLAGDGTKRDRGLMTRTVYGTQHIYACNRGLFLTPGSAATGGMLCSERCVAAVEALRLAAAFTELLVADLEAAGLMRDGHLTPVQPRLLGVG